MKTNKQKAEWETKKLGEVCEIGAGNSAPQKKEMFDKGKYPFFRTSDVGKIHLGIIENSVDMLNEKGIKKLKLFPKGTLLFPKSGASTFLNHRVLMGVKGYVSSHLATIKAKEKFLLDSFLYYYSIIIDSRTLMQYQSYPSLRLSDINKIKILVPSLEEQKQVVKILDEVFESISKSKESAEKNLENAKELFDSYLERVFSNPREDWEEKKLGEVCKVDRGSSPRPIKEYITSEVDGVNWIKIGDTKGIDKYIYNTRQKITPKGALKSRFVDIGDFVLSNSMSFGKPYIMKTQGYIHDGWFVLRLPKNIDTEFFWYLLVSSHVMNQFSSLASGAIVKNISGDLVKKTILPIPPLSEQKTIVSKLGALSKEIKEIEAIYSQKVKNLDELKKSILQKAFSGELTKNAV
jgi:type I restriction enzyme, S subunit